MLTFSRATPNQVKANEGHAENSTPPSHRKESDYECSVGATWRQRFLA